MERISEDHELMIDFAEAKAYADMDFAIPHDLFIHHFRERFPHFEGGRVLDIGCGNADPTIRFARAYPNTETVGIDGSAVMLDFARAAVQRAGLDARIHLQVATVQEYGLDEDHTFDGILCNSVLHHVDPPESVWKAIRRLGKEGAPVLVMDFFRPDTVEQARELTDLYASDSPEFMTGGFYNSLMAAYTPEEIRIQLDNGGLDSFKIEVITDRHMIVHGTL